MKKGRKRQRVGEAGKEGRRDRGKEGGREGERMNTTILRCGCAPDYSWKGQSDKAAHKVG